MSGVVLLYRTTIFFAQFLANVETLNNSKEKNHALADVLMLGYWWIPGQKNNEVFAKIKKAAEDGHNDEVIQSIMYEEHDKYEGREKINYMQNTQIPYLEQNGFRKSLGYVLFWMGYAYRSLGEYEKAIEVYRRVMEVLESSDVYYANAKAAIYGEGRLIEALKSNKNKHFVSPTGELFCYIGNKLYFFAQPGYGCNDICADSSLYWNCSQCDSLIYDPEMKPDDTKISSDGKLTLKFAQSGASVDTPAGHFNDCDVFMLDGERYGLKYAETYFCRGIGIVKQIVERNGRKSIWVLSSYQIKGGEGMIPFAAGNRWQYECLTRDMAINCERENIFEVTGYRDGQAAVASACFVLNLGYNDTWEGNTIKARRDYYDDRECLTDVRPEIERAVELAGTKRQKIHAEIAKNVMFRILDTDPGFNPNYTEKGRWNFFQYNLIEQKKGRVSILNDDRTYSFEWKDADSIGIEGCKILYNFLYDILNDAAGCMWSDEWNPGYEYEAERDGYRTTLNVSGGETVTVPTGTFENCRRVTFERSGLSGGWGYRGGLFHYLFAAGIGIVKMIHPINENTDSVWELTSYRGTGNGYFPVDDGLFRHYEPQSPGNGFHASVEYTFDIDGTGTVMFRNALGTQERAEYEAMIAKA
jgi:tetratricopeptide (TPR) repeat protein